MRFSAAVSQAVICQNNFDVQWETQSNFSDRGQPRLAPVDPTRDVWVGGQLFRGIILPEINLEERAILYEEQESATTLSLSNPEPESGYGEQRASGTSPSVSH